MFSKAGAVGGALGALPQPYGDAIVLFVCAYFAFKLWFYIRKEWKTFNYQRENKQ